MEEPSESTIRNPEAVFLPAFAPSVGPSHSPDLEKGLGYFQGDTPSGPLPPRKGPRLYRYLRWNLGSMYRRIFSIVFFGNILAFAVVYTHEGRLPSYQVCGVAVTANILTSVLTRNEHVVNAVFWVFGDWTKRLPLWARRTVAKVYCYGGIHSGAAVAATLWYVAFLVGLTTTIQSLGTLSVIQSHIYLVSYFIVFLLVCMCITALPRFRIRMHNWFEGIHRYMGWLATALFWAQNVLLAIDASQGTPVSTGRALLISPSFWMLVAITLLLVYPWSRLRLRDVETEVLSDHCVKLNFNYRDVHYGQAIRLSDSPLTETHAFAVIPNPPAPKPVVHCTGCHCHFNIIPAISIRTERANSPYSNLHSNSSHTLNTSQPSIPRSSLTVDLKPLPERPSLLSHTGERGFSVIISDAGDWTKKIIRGPPVSKIYTRGTPQFGVMRIAGLFEPCIIVATGSGIAPCMSLFVQKPDHPVRIIWSTRSPIKTYGQGIVDLLYKTDPRAIIIDTDLPGNKRPDLVKIAYDVWERSKRETPDYYPLLDGRRNTAGRKKPVGQCEAVVVISNQKVTESVVIGLETRGIPAYGAIFDS